MVTLLIVGLMFACAGVLAYRMTKYDERYGEMMDREYDKRKQPRA